MVGFARISTWVQALIIAVSCCEGAAVYSWSTAATCPELTATVTDLERCKAGAAELGLVNSVNEYTKNNFPPGCFKCELPACTETGFIFNHNLNSVETLKSGWNFLCASSGTSAALRIVDPNTLSLTVRRAPGDDKNFGASTISVNLYDDCCQADMVVEHRGITDHGRLDLEGDGSFDALSLCFWMLRYSTSKSSNEKMISYATGDTKNEANAFLVALDFSSGTSELYGHSLGTPLFEFATSGDNGKWHHICVSIKGGGSSSTCFVLEDEEENIFTCPSTFAIKKTGTMVLMQDQDTQGSGFDPSEAFVGRLSRLRIYSQALDKASLLLQGTPPASSSVVALLSSFRMLGSAQREPTTLTTDCRSDCNLVATKSIDGKTEGLTVRKLAYPVASGVRIDYIGRPEDKVHDNYLRVVEITVYDKDDNAISLGSKGVKCVSNDIHPNDRSETNKDLDGYDCSEVINGKFNWDGVGGDRGVHFSQWVYLVFPQPATIRRVEVHQFHDYVSGSTQWDTPLLRVSLLRTNLISPAAPPISEYITISTTCGCETNSGVTRSGYWTETTSNTDCRSKCQAEPGCVAVDRFSSDGWCNWYKEICTEPKHACGSGWSHFRLNTAGYANPSTNWVLPHAYDGPAPVGSYGCGPDGPSPLGRVCSVLTFDHFGAAPRTNVLSYIEVPYVQHDMTFSVPVASVNLPPYTCNPSSCVASPLTNLYQLYAASYEACSSFGCSTGLSTATLAIPGRPASISVGIVDDDNVRVSVDPPMNDGGADITKYIVEFPIQHMQNFYDGALWRWGEVGATCTATCGPMECNAGAISRVNRQSGSTFFNKVKNAVDQSRCTSYGDGNSASHPTWSASTKSCATNGANGQDFVDYSYSVCDMKFDDYARLCPCVARYELTSTSGVFAVPSAVGTTTSIYHTASVYSCTSLGCGNFATTSAAVPPCRPPHLYRVGDLCWSCSSGKFTDLIDAKRCFDVAGVPPFSLDVPAIVTTGDSNSPSINVTGMIFHNVSDRFSNTTYAVLTVYHDVTMTTAPIISSDHNNNGDRIFETAEFIVEAATYDLASPQPMVFNWTFSTMLVFSSDTEIAKYVGVIPLTVSVRACNGEPTAEKKSCGAATTVDTPLHDRPSPPKITSVVAAEQNYALDVLWKAPAFKGPYVPVYSNQSRYHIERRRVDLSHDQWKEVAIVGGEQEFVRFGAGHINSEAALKAAGWSTSGENFRVSGTNSKYSVGGAQDVGCSGAYMCFFGHHTEVGFFEKALPMMYSGVVRVRWGNPRPTYGSCALYLSEPGLSTSPVKTTTLLDVTDDIPFTAGKMLRFYEAASICAVYSIQIFRQGTRWVTPNGLLRSEITAYIYRIRAAYPPRWRWGGEGASCTATCAPIQCDAGALMRANRQSAATFFDSVKIENDVDTSRCIDYFDGNAATHPSLQASTSKCFNNGADDYPGKCDAALDGITRLCPCVALSDYSSESDKASVRGDATSGDIPKLNSIDDRPVRLGGDQIPTKDNNKLSFYVSMEKWTGAPIINFTLQWAREGDCGVPEVASFPKHNVAGPGLLDAALAARSDRFPVTIPAQLAPMTKYHVLVSAQAALVASDLLPQKVLPINVETADRFEMETLKGAKRKNISKSEGNDLKCGNKTVVGGNVVATPPCKTIARALREYHQESFVFVVESGIYDLEKPLTFAERFMQIVSNNNDEGGDKKPRVRCASRCLDLRIVKDKTYAPMMIRGLRFESAAPVEFGGEDQGGAILFVNAPASDDGDMTIEHCEFHGFTAVTHGGALRTSNVRVRLRILSCLFDSNTAAGGEGGAISIDTSMDVLVDNVRCQNNRALKLHGGCLSVTSDSDNGVPSNVAVRSLTSITDQSQRHGGAVFVGRSSEVTMTGSTIQRAEGSSAVYVSSAKATLSNVVVEDTKSSSDDDGAVMCVSSTLKLNGGSKIVRTKGGHGLKSVSCALEVEATDFVENEAVGNGGAMLLISESEIVITDSTFKANTATGDGGAIACEKCTQFEVKNSAFDENTAARGGALFLDNPPASSGIATTTFTNNRALKGGGGGIYRIGKTFPVFADTISFSGNEALYGNNDATDPVVAVVQRDSNELISNTATITGIVFKVMDRNNITVKDKVEMVVRAVSKHDDAPLIEDEPKIVDPKTGAATFNNLILAGAPGSYSIHFSTTVGTVQLESDLTVVVADCVGGQELAPLPGGGSQCRECQAGFIGDGKACQPCPAGTFAPSGATNCSKCVMGEVQRDGDQTLCFVCELGKYSLNPGSIYDGNNFREEPSPLATCQLCQEGASCQHKGLIKAMNGWWRPEPRRNDSFFKCKAAEACLGSANELLVDGEMYNSSLLSKTSFNESCAPGYVGRLCHRCMAGWSRDGTDQCATCLAKGNEAKLLAALGVLCIFIVFGAFIYNSMTTTMKDPTNTSITMKIAAAHLQIIAIAAGLPFRWPATTIVLFRAFDVVSSVSEDVVNLECVYSDESDRSGDTSVVYNTTLLILLGPFFFVMAVTLFWLVVHMMKSRKYRTYLKNRPEEEEELEDIAAEQQHNSIEVAAEEKVDEEVVPPTTTIPSPPTWEQTKQKVIVSMIVVMVLIHPTLTRKSVQLLACDSLGENDPNKYLRRDLQIVCWQGSHLVWATMIGIPFLVLYAVGIPLVSVFVMYRRKHKLHTDESTVSRFGFLYLGCEFCCCLLLLLILLLLLFVVCCCTSF